MCSPDVLGNEAIICWSLRESRFAADTPIPVVYRVNNAT